MNKYINIILISFFGVYFLSYDIKLSLVFPALMFYIYNNKKLIPIVILITSISLLIYSSTTIPIIILLFIVSIYSLFIKSKNIYINSLFIGIINFISLVVINTSFSLNEILLYSAYTTICALVYLLLELNFDTTIIKVKRFSLNELYLSIITIIGSLNLEMKNINLSFILMIFYVMYFSKNNYLFESIILMIISYFLLGTNLFIGVYYKYWYLCVVVGLIYLIPSFVYLITLLAFCILSLLYTKLNIEPLIISEIIAIAIFFEIFKPILVYTYEEKSLYDKIYETQIQKVNNDVNSYARFLDNFSKRYVEAKDYSVAISQGVNTLVNNYCNSCYKKNECFKQNKGKLYTIHKDLLLFASKDELNEASVLEGYCPTIVEMRKSAILINQKLNIKDSYNKRNSLINEIKGITSILNQYTINNSLINEIEYKKINNFKKSILNSGLTLCYFNPKNIIKNDFLIELGFRNTSFNALKEQLEEIATICLGEEVSVIYKEANVTKTYVNCVPKIKIDVTYGYAIHAEINNNVCGDNYMIKPLSDSRLISVICDGMGKGTYANNQSSEMIKMVNDIISLPIVTSTSLQMLNTFYNMEEYLEKYSTLDFLEINRSKKKALFYKMGSASSYIFKEKGKLIKIENENLPFGLDEMVDEKEINIDVGDVIVMSSDGVIDNVIEETEFEKYINQIKHLTSQKMAYEIISYAAKCNVKASDDKCVIVLKIEKAN